MFGTIRHRLVGVVMALATIALGGVASKAHAALSFTCASNVASATCATLNGTIAGVYDGVFSNVNASVYIDYGTTGLGQSTSGYLNAVSYDTYRNALIAEAGGGGVRAAALASLPATEPSTYGGASVEITSALGSALGLPGLFGTTAAGAYCNVGTSGCYNGIITITDNSSLLYYRSGVEGAGQYDYYTIVEHELDEILGTASCISTTGGNLSNGCAYGPQNLVAATDLYRYSAAGARVLIDATPGAKFSYDGGVSNGANGFVYNTYADGLDYADFVSQCPAKLALQSATACPGTSGLDLTNDGSAEINILNAVGYNLVAAAPEPSVWSLMIAGVGVIGGSLRGARSRRLKAVVKA